MLDRRTHRRTRLPERLARACGVVLAVGAALVLVLGPSAGAMTGGAELWVARYNGPGSGWDQAYSVAASPDGTKVFVTGGSPGTGTSYDYATAAYDASTGAELWVTRYNGPGNGDDGASSVAASPDGTRVFVTGGSGGTTTNDDYATLAYDASTGATLWVTRYNGPANGDDVAYSVAASPDGTRVFVTGQSQGTTTNDYATVAYDASTGGKLWVARYNGPANDWDVARSVAASPDGSRVFVSGESPGTGTNQDYATVAYDASTGARLWAKRYNGPANGDDYALSLAASPAGARVFVTGWSEGTGTGEDYATVAYDAFTGARLWAKRYNGPANGNDDALSMAASPDGSRVFVTGGSPGTMEDYATVAYDASTGARLWAKRYNGSGTGGGIAVSLAASPDGSRVFVTGFSGTTTGADYATVAYDASTGARLWAKRYHGPGGLAVARSVAVSPDGSRVFVTGESDGKNGNNRHYATVAYAA